MNPRAGASPQPKYPAAESTEKTEFTENFLSAQPATRWPLCALILDLGDLCGLPLLMMRDATHLHRISRNDLTAFSLTCLFRLIVG